MKYAITIETDKKDIIKKIKIKPESELVKHLLNAEVPKKKKLKFNFSLGKHIETENPGIIQLK